MYMYINSTEMYVSTRVSEDSWFSRFFVLSFVLISRQDKIRTVKKISRIKTRIKSLMISLKKRKVFDFSRTSPRKYYRLFLTKIM